MLYSIRALAVLAAVLPSSVHPHPQFNGGLADFFSGDGGNSFDFNSFQSGSDDDDDDENLEMVPYETISKIHASDNFTYELREYGRSKWVCTAAVLELDDRRPGMFLKLFGYISGANAARAEVQMTRPVLTTVTPLAADNSGGGGGGQMIGKRMCFYLEAAHQAEPPAPTAGSGITIEEIGPMSVYVHEFDGWVMQDSAWALAAKTFSEALGPEGMAGVEADFYHTAGYDSPMKLVNRRNEVMFQLKPTELDGGATTEEQSVEEEEEEEEEDEKEEEEEEAEEEEEEEEDSYEEDV